MYLPGLLGFIKVFSTLSFLLRVDDEELRLLARYVYLNEVTYIYAA